MLEITIHTGISWMACLVVSLIRERRGAGLSVGAEEEQRAYIYLF